MGHLSLTRAAARTTVAFMLGFGMLFGSGAPASADTMGVAVVLAGVVAASQRRGAHGKPLTGAVLDVGLAGQCGLAGAFLGPALHPPDWGFGWPQLQAPVLHGLCTGVLVGTALDFLAACDDASDAVPADGKRED